MLASSIEYSNYDQRHVIVLRSARRERFRGRQYSIHYLKGRKPVAGFSELD